MYIYPVLVPKIILLFSVSRIIVKIGYLCGTPTINAILLPWLTLKTLS